VASALNHPNIAVIYEIDEVERDDGWHSFIAMEYVPGHTLKELARAHPLDVGEAVALVRQVAEALAEAHDRGVVHRDVKSSNVMVTDNRRVKVLDFGLAQYSPRRDDTTSTWSRAPHDFVAHGLVGTAETVTAELKCVDGLTVVGRERVWEVLRKLGAVGAPDEAQATSAGRELGARWVITGGYQRLGETVRVTARVTEVDTGAIVH